MIALAVFGLIASLVVQFLEEPVPMQGEPSLGGDGLDQILDDGSIFDVDSFEEPTDPDPEIKVQGKSFSLLAVCTDYQPNAYDDYFLGYDAYTQDYEGLLVRPFRQVSAASIVLLQFSSENKTFSYLTIPVNMRVHFNLEQTTVGEIYGKYGIETLVQTVYFNTGIPIDYYTVTHLGNMPNLMNVIGSVTIDVPFDVYETETGYTTVAPTASEEGGETADVQAPVQHITAGRVTVNASNVIPLFAVTDYESEDLPRTQIAAAWMRAVVEKLCANNSSETCKTIFASLSRHFAETNLTGELFAESALLVSAYRNLSVAQITYPGVYRKMSGKYVFLPTERAISELAPYRMRTAQAAPAET